VQSEGAKSHRVERQYGEFLRTFALPEKVKGEDIEASYENGVLYLVLPKSEATSPKKIEIAEPKGGLFKKIAGLGKEEDDKDKKITVNG
jgi:HSP20 family protein